MSTQKIAFFLTISFLCLLLGWHLIAKKTDNSVTHKKGETINPPKQELAHKDNPELTHKDIIGLNVTNGSAENTSNPAENESITTAASLATLYQEHETANTPHSKLKLAGILETCSRYSSEAVAALDRIDEFVNPHSEGIQKLVADLIDGHKKCKSVYEYLPNENFKELSLAWLEFSAEARHPVAKLRSLYNYPDLPLPKNVLPLIYESFELAETEPGLLEDIYMSLLSYHSDNIDDQFNEQRLTLNRDAWDYLACLNTNFCEASTFISQNKDSFHLHDYEANAVIERATELQNHIDNHNWDALELAPK